LLPHIAALFDVEVPPGAPTPKPLRSGPHRPDAKKRGAPAAASAAKAKSAGGEPRDAPQDGDPGGAPGADGAAP
jgi:hypothetical protein